MDWMILAIPVVAWLVVGLTGVSVLARRKLDRPVWGRVMGYLGVILMPPLGLVYLMALTLLPATGQQRR